MMRILQIYRTEGDWCALVAHQGWRMTLTYPAGDQPPDEAQVLDDAEHAIAAWMAEDFEPPVRVDETTTLGEKKALVRGRVVSAAALAGTEAELLPVQAALDAVAEGLSE
jgi:hypothetical protein